MAAPPKSAIQNSAPTLAREACASEMGWGSSLGLLDMRCCIISLATNDKRFPEGLARLQESVRRSGFAGDLLLWQSGGLAERMPSHRDAPYAFKPYCFREARTLGVNLALWIDASGVALRKLGGLFQAMGSRADSLN